MILIDKKIQNVRSVRERLLTEMKEGLFAKCEKLPRETVLAEKLGISRTKLMTTFKEYTGITLNNYLTQYRIKKAIQHLLDGETVQVVAEKCGFGDPSNFIRAFRTQYNTTPINYIKKVKGNPDK